MSEPFIGEIKFIAFNYAPRGYAFCSGQIMQIAQNQALFSILTTTYGGDGRTTFALPNLQGRVPVHVGNGITLGQMSGEENHLLTPNEMPQHTHQVLASSQDASQFTPAGNYLAKQTTVQPYAPPSTADTLLVSTEVANTGGNVAHNNMQPYLVLNAVIALTGFYPSRD
jgi:microcystin-dependent protein